MSATALKLVSSKQYDNQDWKPVEKQAIEDIEPFT